MGQFLLLSVVRRCPTYRVLVGRTQDCSIENNITEYITSCCSVV